MTTVLAVFGFLLVAVLYLVGSRLQDLYERRLTRLVDELKERDSELR